MAWPLRVYRVGVSQPAPQPIAAPATLPLPDKPSIAVVRFTNMSGDPEQDYFADGMVEEIITATPSSARCFCMACAWRPARPHEPDPPSYRDPRRGCGRLFTAFGGRRGGHARAAPSAPPGTGQSEDRRAQGPGRKEHWRRLLGRVRMGELDVKNIPRPVQVYALRSEGTAGVPNVNVSPATSSSLSAAAPRLSIVVLPFTILSNDPERGTLQTGSPRI